jgi:hypothetical protein
MVSDDGARGVRREDEEDEEDEEEEEEEEKEEEEEGVQVAGEELGAQAEEEEEGDDDDDDDALSSDCSSRSSPSPSPSPSPSLSPHCRSSRRLAEFQWFFTALSVLPGRNLAISAHRLSSCLWARRRMVSSAWVQGTLQMDGSSWLCQRSRHCIVAVGEVG